MAGAPRSDLPGDLACQLAAGPADQDYAIVDNGVVLIEAATGLILDILVDTTPAPAGGCRLLRDLRNRLAAVLEEYRRT